MLSISKHNAACADPQKILDDLISSQSFFGIPVLIIPMDALYSPSLHQDIRKKISSYPSPTRTILSIFNRKKSSRALLTELYNQQANTIARCAYDIRQGHYVAPYSFRYDLTTSDIVTVLKHKSISPAKAGIIISPMQNDPITYVHEAQASDKSRFDHEHIPSTYRVVCHELAHTLGAAEPHADHIAALMARQAFPHSRTSMIFADSRAIDIVIKCVNFLGGADQILKTQSHIDSTKFGNPVHESHARHRLIRLRIPEATFIRLYGWSVVEAGDDANALPDSQIESLTIDDIKETLNKTYDPKLNQLMDLAALICKNPHIADDILSADIARINASAAAVFHFISSRKNDSVLIDMSRRFALAAHRLHRGPEAYNYLETSSSVPAASALHYTRL